MAVFSVHLPPSGAAGASDAAFVREGFSVGAFLFGPLWLAAGGFFLAAALWLVGAIALAALALAGALSGGAALALLFLAQLWLGFEAGRLAERRLRRRGFNLAEIVAAPSLEEAEMSFFRAGAEAPQGAPAPQRPGAAPRPPSGGVLGLFPQPERKGGAS